MKNVLAIEHARSLIRKRAAICMGTSYEQLAKVTGQLPRSVGKNILQPMFEDDGIEEPWLWTCVYNQRTGLPTDPKTPVEVIVRERLRCFTTYAQTKNILVEHLTNTRARPMK